MVCELVGVVENADSMTIDVPSEIGQVVFCECKRDVPAWALKRGPANLSDVRVADATKRDAAGRSVVSARVRAW